MTKQKSQERRVRFASEAAQAMAEYLADQEAVRVRTAELKARRLEREVRKAAEEAVAAEKKIEGAEKAKQLAERRAVEMPAVEKEVRPFRPRKRVLSPRSKVR